MAEEERKTLFEDQDKLDDDDSGDGEFWTSKVKDEPPTFGDMNEEAQIP